MHNELPLLSTQRAYVCPGEEHPIPRSIHLARLAAYYPKCRECQHRHDTGQLPRSTVGRLEQTAARVVLTSPFGPDGVRGEYLNQLTRSIAGRVGAAVADRLWEAQPLIGRLPADEDETLAPAIVPALVTLTHRPTVVLGHDARPSSPDLTVGISGALRRMGCEVVDVGRVTAPCHTFAVDHLQADAGLFVTGSGCPARWAGIDLLGPRGVPWSLGDRLAITDVSSPEASAQQGTLQDIERRFLGGIQRPTRHGGSLRYFDADLSYRANLLKHFRDLRPLRVVCATADPVLLQTLQTVFELLPCDLIPLVDPAANLDPARVDERVVRQIRTAIRETTANLGVAISEEGRGVCLFDERGRLVNATTVLLHALLLSRGGRPATVCLPPAAAGPGAAVAVAGHALEQVAGGREGLARRLYEPDRAFALEAGGRLWIHDAIPTCDAVLTLGLLLGTLSRHPEAFREQILAAADGSSR